MTQKRTRLSPQHRREQLLNATRQYIVKNGLNSLTMDSLAQFAAVSKPLLYKYFDSRLELLQTVLLREDERLQRQLGEALAEVKNFEDVVYAVVNLNFDQAIRGEVLTLLSSQPDIVAALRPVQKKRSGVLGKELVDGLMSEYAIPQPEAEQFIRMASAASQSIADHHGRAGGNRQHLVDFAVQFIFNGLQNYAKAT